MLVHFFSVASSLFLRLAKMDKTSRKGGIFFGKIKREENLCGNTFEFFVNKSVTHSEVEEGGHKYRTHRNTLELFVYTRKCLWKTLCAFFSHLPHHRWINTSEKNKQKNNIKKKVKKRGSRTKRRKEKKKRKEKKDHNEERNKTNNPTKTHVGTLCCSVYFYSLLFPRCSIFKK